MWCVLCGVWLGLKVQLFVEVCYLSRVIYNPVTTTEGKKPFAVCSKGLYFPTVDLSLKLVEWIEVQRALGADKICLSNMEVHPNMMKAIINNTTVVVELSRYSLSGIGVLCSVWLPGGLLRKLPG